jgi:NodT family efflux transporter outer membrane factor (OMF) lipoprotein
MIRFVRESSMHSMPHGQWRPSLTALLAAVGTLASNRAGPNFHKPRVPHGQWRPNRTALLAAVGALTSSGAGPNFHKPRAPHSQWQRSRTALLAAVAALASGCAVGPNFHKSPAPADADYAPAPLPESSAAADIHGGEAQHYVPGGDIPFQWWELFQSPALNSLIERAFKANPTITAAQAALAQAQELVYAQQGFYFPSVGATYQAERHKIAGNLTNDQAPGVQGNGDNLSAPLQTPGVPPYTKPLYYNFQTAELTVGFVPDVFGGNRRQVESLAAQTEVKRFALEATYITLASNVAAAAIQEASLRAQIRATQDIIAADEKALSILRDEFRLGQAMRIDVALLETALAQAKATLPPLQLAFEQGRDLIRALVGNLPNQDVAETFELDALHLPPEVPVSLPAKIIEQRPDVRAAEAQLHSANAQVGVAVAAMLPQFSITGSYGGNADQFSWMFRHGGPFWNLVGDVTQPLFEGGTLLHRKRAAQQALKQAAAQYQSAVITAYQNVADTLHASLCDADALAANVDAERAAKVTYELTQRQMQTGYVNTLILIAAETAYDQALLGRVQAQAARYGDTVALFQALGGGWWNRTAKASAAATASATATASAMNTGVHGNAGSGAAASSTSGAREEPARVAAVSDLVGAAAQ